MKVIKITNVEDLLHINCEIVKIEIEPNVIMHYIHQNKDNVETKINICELRNAYAKSINRSYEFKRYNDNICTTS